jgi:hypothetical protein
MASSTEALQQQVEALKLRLDHMFLPTYLDQLTARVGEWDVKVRDSYSNSAWCWYISLLILLLFAILVLAMGWIIWKGNHWKALMQTNQFGRHTKERTCYACYRPWRRNKYRAPVKNAFSAPEYDDDQVSAPLPPFAG